MSRERSATTATIQIISLERRDRDPIRSDPIRSRASRQNQTRQPKFVSLVGRLRRDASSRYLLDRSTGEGLPVLEIYGNFTARSAVPPLPVVLVPFLAAVDAAAEGILAQVVPLQGRRGRATLPPLLLAGVGTMMFGRCPGGDDGPGGLARRVDVPRRPRRSLRRLLLRLYHRVPLADERYVPVDHVVLQVSRPVIVGLRELRRRATALAPPLRAGRAQFAHQLAKGLADLVLGVAGICKTISQRLAMKVKLIAYAKKIFVAIIIIMFLFCFFSLTGTFTFCLNLFCFCFLFLHTC